MLLLCMINGYHHSLGEGVHGTSPLIGELNDVGYDCAL